jgi:hypothetical protein
MTSPKSSYSTSPAAKRPQPVPQRRRGIGMSGPRPANVVALADALAQAPDQQPLPAVGPLTVRATPTQAQPGNAGPVPGAVRPPTTDESVAALHAFLQRRDLPPSPKMKAALDHMRDVVQAHAANNLDETDLRIAMTTMDMILIARQGVVPLGDALRAQRGPRLTEPTYKVVVDGDEISSVNAAQIRQLQLACFGNPYEKDTRALALVLEGFGFQGTMQELVDLVCAVHRCLPDPGRAQLAQGETAVDKGPGVAGLVQKLLADEAAERGILGKLFTNAGLDVQMAGITAPQCRALRAWLTMYPAYLTNLKRMGVNGFVFGSTETLDVGEYMPGRREVHMSAQPDKPADAFVRLLLHETGHAGFQRALIGDNLAGKSKLENARAYGALRSYVEYVRARAVAAKAGLPEPARTVNVNAGERLWPSLSPNAQRYYQAWITLKQNRGEFLIGEDQGRASNDKDMTEEDRQDYQATTFIEICAEGFSTFAMGDVDAFNPVIQSHVDVPDEVRDAWADLDSVLRDVGGQILGDPAFG